MKRSTLLAGLSLLLGGSMALAADGGLKAGDHVAIIGDSITEQKQYSVMMEEYLLACQPAKNLQTMQFGWGGETAGGFKRRMENDCFRFHPTAATTCYGMNDGGYSPQTPAKAKSYKDNQTAIVEGMKKAGVRLIVVGSPGCVDSYTFKHDKTDASDKLSEKAEMYNPTLASERDIAKEVAQEQGVIFADVFDPMVSAMKEAKAKYGNKYPVAGGDGVHPGANGHLIMAYAFLKGLGCDGNIGTISVDLAANKATATDGHKVLSDNNGVVEIESTRYPFCFPAKKGAKLEDPSNARGILPFVPFNQDLNRLTLVVTGASTGKVKVTWGDESKEFEAAQLAKGINLAAEFLDNPFVEPFEKVHAAVVKQQAFETPMIKTTINGIAFPKKPAAPKAGQVAAPVTNEPPKDPAKIVEEATAKDNALSEDAVKSVEAVKHTIKVEAVK
ncbi:MAG TPA: SGNH/GDSL hydrolase family protein [Tepidisphaeraceae bacterium]|jgi:lysophospholipase L1-like esterase|nr:SGNH/GDSL hydrolase family protein [Tepidisphaeraceae bacterium]